MFNQSSERADVSRATFYREIDLSNTLYCGVESCVCSLCQREKYLKPSKTLQVFIRSSSLGTIVNIFAKTVIMEMYGITRLSLKHLNYTLQGKWLSYRNWR